ncbi:MAG: guanylate kinase [Pseudomonadota bacterium]|jgi:guanylate kinase
MVAKAPPASRRGLLYVLSSPSGAGKTTLSKRLMEGDSNIAMSVSVTTRAPRPGEVHGKDYFFIDEAEFKRLDAAGELLESAQVYSHRFYGTPKAFVTDMLNRGRDVLFDIDWQGARQIADKMPTDCVRVFILPPSGRALEQRLKNRAQDPPEEIARRMAKAADEISHWREYDYVIVNDDLDEATAAVRHILSAERKKRIRQPGLDDFVQGVLADLKA